MDGRARRSRRSRFHAGRAQPASDATPQGHPRLSFLLDISTVIALQRNRPPDVRRRLVVAQRAGDLIAVSSIVLFELRYGVARSRRAEQNAEWLDRFLDGGVTVLPFEPEDAEIAGDLRARLESVGSPIGPYDLLIAAQAIHRKLTVVTDNAAEFARVPGLAWENWTA